MYTFFRSTRRLICAACLVLSTFLMAVPPAMALDTHMSDRQTARVEERMTEVKERLNLTPEQQKKLEPIFRESVEERAAALRAYGFYDGIIPKLSFLEKVGIGREMHVIRANTSLKASEVLDDTQMAEFEEIQKEQRTEFRKRLEATGVS